MREMRMMLHIPADAPDYTEEMVKQLKNMMDVCGRTQTINQKSWDLYFDDAENSCIAYSKTKGWEEHWSNDPNTMKGKRWARVIMMYTCENPRSPLGIFRTLSGSAILIPRRNFPSEVMVLPRDNGERFIDMQIDFDLWKQVDQSAFIQAVQEACVALKATYACIDEEAPLGGIYECYFKWLSRETADVEKKLPGIYWVQMFSQEMVSATGRLAEIAEKAPCERAECFDGERMLLAQISTDFARAVPRKRMAMRTFFQDSLYRISLDRGNASFAAGDSFSGLSKNMWNELMMVMKKIPLTADEIETVLALVEGGE